MYLQPGEEKTVILEISKTDLAGYYMEFGEWITQPGEFDILVGTSSRDIASVNRINVLCKDPFGWNGRASIGKIATNTDAVEIINRIIEDDILVLFHVAMEFAPDKSIHELWGGTNIQSVLHNKGWDDACIAAKYNQIMEEFDSL